MRVDNGSREWGGNDFGERDLGIWGLPSGGSMKHRFPRSLPKNSIKITCIMFRKEISHPQLSTILIYPLRYLPSSVFHPNKSVISKNKETNLISSSITYSRKKGSQFLAQSRSSFILENNRTQLSHSSNLPLFSHLFSQEYLPMITH